MSVCDWCDRPIDMDESHIEVQHISTSREHGEQLLTLAVFHDGTCFDVASEQGWSE